MVKFYREALRAGVKPIIGVDLLVREEGERSPALAPDAAVPDPGWLPQSRAPGEPRLPGGPGARDAAHRARLADARENLARPDRAVRGARGGYRARAGATAREAEAERALSALARALSRAAIYLELQRLGRPFEEAYISRRRGARRAARGAGGRHQRRALPQRPRSSTRTRRAFASTTARCSPTRGACAAIRGSSTCAAPQEMAALFADIPEALANSVEIARRCSLALKLGEARLPQYPVPAGSQHRRVPARGSRARPRRSASAAWREARRRPPCAPRQRARRHLPDGLRRLLPHRRRLHPLGARERRAGRPGPRLGRGLARRLQSRDHRPRSARATTCCSSAS